MGSLRDREVACSASNFKSCVWRQCHLIHLTILRIFSWPSLYVTENPIIFISFLRQHFFMSCSILFLIISREKAIFYLHVCTFIEKYESDLELFLYFPFWTIIMYAINIIKSLLYFSFMQVKNAEFLPDSVAFCTYKFMHVYKINCEIWKLSIDVFCENTSYKKKYV